MKFRNSQLAPTALFGGSLVFLYLPILIVVAYSFNQTSFPEPLSAVTLKWYRLLFNNGEVWESFSNSCIVSIASTLISLALTSLLLYYRSLGKRVKKLIPLFYGNLLIPDSVLAIALVSYFSLMHIPLGLTTIIIAHTVVGLGLSIPMLNIRYDDLDYSLIEASKSLGATHPQTFFRIILPYMAPALFATGLLIFIFSFDDFILSYFCAGSTAQTLSLFLVAALRFGVSPMINALATLVLVFTIAIVALFFSLRSKKGVGI